MTWEGVAVALVLCMVPFANLNPVLYAKYFPWRATKEGRAVVLSWVGLALLIDAATFYMLVPSFPGKPLVAVVIYAVILVGLIRWTVVLLRLLKVCSRRRAKTRRDH